MRQYLLKLTKKQRQELEWARSRHPKAYIRERAAAILKVADGKSLRWVAKEGLLKPHEPETVSKWIKDYLSGGLAALEHKPRRKLTFSPKAEEDSEGDGKKESHPFWHSEKQMDAFSFEGEMPLPLWIQLGRRLENFEEAEFL